MDESKICPNCGKWIDYLLITSPNDNFCPECHIRLKVEESPSGVESFVVVEPLSEQAIQLMHSIPVNLEEAKKKKRSWVFMKMYCILVVGGLLIGMIMPPGQTAASMGYFYMYLIVSLFLPSIILELLSKKHCPRCKKAVRRSDDKCYNCGQRFKVSSYF